MAYVEAVTQFEKIKFRQLLNPDIRIHCCGSSFEFRMVREIRNVTGKPFSLPMGQTAEFWEVQNNHELR